MLEKDWERICVSHEGRLGSVLDSQDRAACAHSSGEQFQGLLRCVGGAGRGDQRVEIT